MKSLKLILVTLLSLSSFFASAEIKTETLKVWGNCGMCQTRIENAAKLSGATSASWDVDSKILTVSFDDATTSLSAIETKIASAGHDTKNLNAPKEAYDKLHGCCRYDRKEVGIVSASCCSSEKVCKDKKSTKLQKNKSNTCINTLASTIAVTNGAKGVSGSEGASCNGKEKTSCNKTKVAVNASSIDCCTSGSACCGTGSSCCSKSEPSAAVAKDCCTPGSACCNTGSTCCSKSEPSAAVAKDCCASGASCCQEGASCCNKTVKVINLTTKDCCAEGAECCKTGAACCTKKAA